MKVSVFTTATRPAERGDLFQEALASYEFADELVMISGGGVQPRADVFIRHYWPQEFSWEFIGEQFQRGYEAATGDWVIHADLDFIFHENDFDAIRQAMKDNSEAPALSFWKYQFILPDRYTLKSRLVLAVNKAKYGDRIQFDSGGDLCQPSLDGKLLTNENVPEAKIAFFNYDKLLKNKAQIMDDVGRMARAWQRYFGTYKLGGPENENAYDEWLAMMLGRFNSHSQKHISIGEHPKFMQTTILSLMPHQWGYAGLGHLPVNDYVKARMQ